MTTITMSDLLSVDAAGFWARVDMSGDCWLWQGTIRSNGYGSCYVPAARSSTSAHRVAYVVSGGDIPAGHEVDHLCRVRACVNPSHLEPVTTAENVRRASWEFCSRGHARTIGTECRECKNVRQTARRAVVQTFDPKPLGAFQRAKTECPQGHSYDSANTYLTPSGKRMCRTCARARTREWKARCAVLNHLDALDDAKGDEDA